MAEDNDAKKIKRWTPMSKRPTGRPKKRCEDEVLEDIKSMNVCNWKNVAQNRDRWKKVVEQARTVNRLWCFIRRRRNGKKWWYKKIKQIKAIFVDLRTNYAINGNVLPYMGILETAR